MLDWAKKEIEIAKKDTEGSEFSEYIELCYDSAYKAYQSLVEDEHSGMSISITKDILERLIDHKPLTLITDHDFVRDETTQWKDMPLISEEYLKKTNQIGCIQCPRMSSLFKHIYTDGRVVYSDTDRVVVHFNRDSFPCHSSTVSRVIDQMFPITLPYQGERIDAYAEEHLLDSAHGDFDVVILRYCIKDGTRYNLNKYYIETGSVGPMQEVSRIHYWLLFLKAKLTHKFVY